MKEDKKNLAFIGKDLSISLTRYNTLSQSQSMVGGSHNDVTGLTWLLPQILAPCTIDFSLVDTAEGTTGHLEIIESVDLTVSPATVRLLLHVVQSIPKNEVVYAMCVEHDHNTHTHYTTHTWTWPWQVTSFWRRADKINQLIPSFTPRTHAHAHTHTHTQHTHTHCTLLSTLL